jgi:ubiquitin-protein ligase
MKSIQLNAINKELEELEKNKELIPTSIKRLRAEEILINITIKPTLLIDSPIKIEKELEFLLYLRHNFPINAPRLYFLTKDENLNFYDGRDILEDIIEESWSNQYKITSIINSIPKFIIDYLKNKINDNTKIVGKFYLDEIYNLDILKKLPFKFFGQVTEITIMNGKNEIEESRFLFITENFFLLFIDTGLFNVGNMKLSFWAYIKSLDTIKQTRGSNLCEFIWKVKFNKKFSLKIKSFDDDNIVNIMMENLKHENIDYKLTTKNLGPKSGELPKIDIEKVEEDIIHSEINLKNPDNLNEDNVNNIVELYKKAVQYYSAVNDKKYEIYTKKIQDIIVDPKLGELLNKAIEKKKENEEKEKKIKEEENKNEEIKKEEKKEDIKIEEKKEEVKIEEKNEEEKKIEENNKSEEKLNEKIEEKKEKDEIKETNIENNNEKLETLNAKNNSPEKQEKKEEIKEETKDENKKKNRTRNNKKRRNSKSEC